MKANASTKVKQVYWTFTSNYGSVYYWWGYWDDIRFTEHKEWCEETLGGKVEIVKDIKNYVGVRWEKDSL